MASFFIPQLKTRFFDANGLPLVGGKLYTYTAGTTTPKATYTDYDLTPNANPVILDANGEAIVRIDTGYYKFVLKDANDVVQWTLDKVGHPTNAAAGVPSGGAANYILQKVDGTDYNTAWVAFNPPPTITGTRASPSLITDVGGIVFTGSLYENVWFVQGSGGAVTVTANPQIAAGTSVGQRLTLIGRSDTNTLTFSDGTGLYTGGQTLKLGANSIVKFIWDGTNWVLASTNGLI